MEMTRRFILLYRHFRHKKFGEALPQKLNCPDEVDDLFDDDKEFILKIKALQKKDAFAEVKKFEEIRKQQERD